MAVPFPSVFAVSLRRPRDWKGANQQDGPKLSSTKVEPRRGCCRIGLDGPQAGVAEEFLNALYVWACLCHFELLDCFVCQFITCFAQWWTDVGHLGSGHSRYMQFMPRCQSGRISFSVCCHAKVVLQSWRANMR